MEDIPDREEGCACVAGVLQVIILPAQMVDCGSSGILGPPLAGVQRGVQYGHILHALWRMDNCSPQGRRIRRLHFLDRSDLAGHHPGAGRSTLRLKRQRPVC